MGDIRVNVQVSAEAGVAPAYTTPTTTDNYKVRNNGQVKLYVKKTGAGACNLTVITPATVGPGSLAVADLVVVIPATTGERWVGPFSASVYNDAAGDINFGFSEVTGLSFAVLGN